MYTMLAMYVLNVLVQFYMFILQIYLPQNSATSTATRTRAICSAVRCSNYYTNYPEALSDIFGYVQAYSLILTLNE